MLRFIGKPLELLYRGVNRANRAAYRRGLRTSRTLPRPVVSIGNRAVGGTGKTPTTIALARLLTSRGLRVAVLTRGYARAGSDAAALVSSGDAARFGDEPVLIARAVPNVSVIVGSDRYAAGEWFLQTSDCDLFLLDDGFQHLRLARDCDIVIEASDARWLREGTAALRDADVVLTAGDDATADSPPHYHCALTPTLLRDRDAALPLETLRGMRVVAFAALADNARFFDSLRSLGAVVLATREFRDHHRYSPADVAALTQLSREVDGRLVTTAKDAVKLSGVDALVLEVEMKFESPDRLVDLILKQSGLDR